MADQASFSNNSLDPANEQRSQAKMRTRRRSRKKCDRFPILRAPKARASREVRGHAPLENGWDFLRSWDWKSTMNSRVYLNSQEKVNILPHDRGDFKIPKIWPFSVKRWKPVWIRAWTIQRSPFLGLSCSRFKLLSIKQITQTKRKEKKHKHLPWRFDCSHACRFPKLLLLMCKKLACYHKQGDFEIINTCTETTANTNICHVYIWWR